MTVIVSGMSESVNPEAPDKATFFNVAPASLSILLVRVIMLDWLFDLELREDILESRLVNSFRKRFLKSRREERKEGAW